MNGSEVSGSAVAASPENLMLVNNAAGRMSAWLKFLGIINIAGGAICAITIVGILFAWLPIWLGVILFQAGDRAYQTQFSPDLMPLLQLLQKLRLYFLVTGVITIISVAMMVGFFVFATVFFDQFGQELQQLFMNYQ